MPTWKDVQAAFTTASTPASEFTWGADYVRYSSELQTENSEKDQLEAIARVRKQFGLPVVPVYFDRAKPGWSDRDGLQNLIDAAREERRNQRGAGFIIVREPSRLSRDEPLKQAAMILELRNLGIKAIFFDSIGRMDLPKSHDLGQAFNWLSQAGISHSGSTTISYNIAQSFISRMNRLEQAHKNQPGWSVTGKPRLLDPTGSRPTFGYVDHHDGDKFYRVIHPEHAEILRDMYRKYLSGWTTGRIAGWLNKSGIPTPMAANYTKKRPGRKPTKWHSNTVLAVLGRLANIGVFKRGEYHSPRFNAARKSGVAKVPDELTVNRKNRKAAPFIDDEADCWQIPDSWEPIVDAATFKAARKKMAPKKREAPRETTGAFRGVLHCAHCGEPLATQRVNVKGRRHGQVYYVCRCEDGKECWGGQIYEWMLAPTLMDELHKANAGERQRLEALLATPPRKNAPAAKLVAQERDLAKRLQASQERLGELWIQDPDNTNLPVLMKANDKLAAELAGVRKQIQESSALPVDAEQEVRERLAWLEQNAMAVREWVVASNAGRETTFGPDDELADGQPYPPDMDHELPGVVRYAPGKVWQLDRHKVRELCRDMGLKASVRWLLTKAERKKRNRMETGPEFQISFTCCPVQGSPNPESRSNQVQS